MPPRIELLPECSLEEEREAWETSRRMQEMMLQAAAIERATADEILGEGHTGPKVLELAENAMQYVDWTNNQLPASEAPACRAGCYFCCAIPVGVTAPEALRIAQFIRDELPAPRQEAVLSSLRKTVARVAGLSADVQAEAKVFCGLLQGAGCSVYPARPLHCRGWTSNSRERCEAGFAAPWTSTVQPHMGIYLFTNGTISGLHSGLRAAGLEDTSYELNAAVLCAFDTPDAAARWARGENIFAGCRVMETVPMLGLTPEQLRQAKVQEEAEITRRARALGKATPQEQDRR